MASSGYTPLPSEPAYDPPPAYAAGPPGGYDKNAAQGTAPYPGSYQSGAQYGFYPVGPSAPTPAQGSYVQVYQTAPSVIVIGGCPACRVGVLEDEYSCLGIFCAIVFFPLGLLCCLAMKHRVCPNCGAVFG